MTALRTVSALAVGMPSLARSRRIVQRNMVVCKHVWMAIVSGFFEPVFYLLGVGVGLGALVPDIDGVAYSAFVAPGLLAASCMNGAINDGFFNVHFKLHVQKTYDGILATPMRVPDVALGEALWALIRSSIYAGAFLLVVLALGIALGRPMLLSRWAVLALPAAILASASFAAIALCLTSIARKVEDFDIVMGLFVMPMFLLSGTFFPISQFPESVQRVVQTLPLYHAVAMLRQLTTGAVDGGILGHMVYLVLVGAAAFAVATWRLERVLVK